MESLPLHVEHASERGRPLPVGASLAAAERELILATVDHCGGDKNETARVLGISLKTLYNRLHKYGVMGA